MKHVPSAVRIWDAPKAKDVGETVEEFLTYLNSPTWLILPGYDRSRCRGISTLLHGNEPSGIRALFHWIRSGEQPHVDLVCFIGAVEAARAQPGFAHRSLVGRRDLNRCFREPFADSEGKVAAEVLTKLWDAKPEALIDLHNTSGNSPAYGVTTVADTRQKALTSLFSEHLILTDLRLGTLMEATEHDFPTITVECGRAGDPRADAVAMKGVTAFARAPSLDDLESYCPRITVWKHPIRVELADGARMASGTAAVSGADVTLRSDADQYNFRIAKPGEVLGWLGPRGLAGISAQDSGGRDRTSTMFSQNAGSLVVSRPVHVLMMTTDPTIAQNDCLFYCIPAEDEH